MHFTVKKLGMVPYKEALSIQEKTQRERIAGNIPDTLLLLEHPSVLTLGKRTQPGHIRLSDKELCDLGVDVVEINRGGDVTYHGPGQLVGYPIFDLKEHGKDIRQFVYNLERVFIRLLQEDYAISSHAESDRHTGVFVKENKITAFGISVHQWVTMHGFALNVNTNLSHFDWIVPCGLTDRGVVSIERLTGVTQDMGIITERVADLFGLVFGMERVSFDSKEATLKNL